MIIVALSGAPTKNARFGNLTRLHIGPNLENPDMLYLSRSGQPTRVPRAQSWAVQTDALLKVELLVVSVETTKPWLTLEGMQQFKF